jgi:hypothetical protein
MMYLIGLHLASLKESDMPEFDIAVWRVPRDEQFDVPSGELNVFGDVMLFPDELLKNLVNVVDLINKDAAELPTDDDDSLAGETRAGWPRPGDDD